MVRIKFVFILITILGFACQVYSQHTLDSIEYSSENETDFNKPQVKKVYHDFTRQMKEEKLLIKFGLDNITNKNFRRFKDLGINEQFFKIKFGVGIEKKLTHEYSILFDWKTMYEKYSYSWPTFQEENAFSMNGIDYNSAAKTNLNIFYVHEFTVGAKFYFTQTSRIAQGISANNFSSNYIFLKYTQRINIKDSDRFLGNTNYLPNYEKFGKISLGIGTQRRLSSFGFFDVHAGPAYYYNNKEHDISIFDFSFTIGFGI